MQPNIVELSIPAPDNSMVVDAQRMLTIATEYRVTTPQAYAEGGEQLKAIKAKFKELEGQRKEITVPLDNAKKAVMNLFAKPLDFLTRAEATIKRGLIAYNEEQLRLQREEQRKADEAARKERERIEAQARKAAESGKVEKAVELEQRAATVVAPVVHREPPKVAGVSMRDFWTFEITDPSKVNAAFLMPDEQKIRKLVQSMKGDAGPLLGEGVRVYCEKRMASGAA